MKVGTRLYIGFGGIIVVLLVMFFLSQVSLERMTSNQKSLQTSSHLYDQIAHVDSLTEKMQRYIILYANTGMKSVFNSVNALSQELEQRLVSIKALSNNDQQLKIVASMQHSLQLLSEQFERASQDRYRRDDILNGKSIALVAAIENDFKKIRLVPSVPALLSSQIKEQLTFSEMSMVRSQQSMLLYVTGPDSIRSKASRRHLLHAIKSLKALQPQLDGKEYDEITSRMVTNMRDYKKQTGRIFRLTRGYLFIFNGVIAGQAAEFSRSSQELKELSLSERNHLFLTLNDTISEFSLGLTVAACFSVIFGVFFAWYTAHGIIQPLHHITATLITLSKGKFVDKIPGLESKNEIGDMAKSAQVFKEKNNLTEQLLIEAQRTEHALLKNKEELKQHQENLETMVKERTQALEESIIRLNNTQTQLAKSERMASIGSMVQGVAHELNTPVGLALTAASHIHDSGEKLSINMNKDKLTKSELTEYLSTTLLLTESMSTSLERAAQLIKSFKLVSVSEHQEHLQAFNLCEHLNNLLASMQRSIDPKYKINNQISNDIVITSYPGVFYQIYTNLMNNSVLHGFEGKSEGNITISAVLDNDELVLSYRDDGVGMTEATKANIFEPFFTTKRAKGGTGLGMSIVQALVNDKLHGEIDLNSILGIGTTYKLLIPIVNHSTLVDINDENSAFHKE